MLRRVILGRTGLEVSTIGFGGIPIMKVDKDTAKSAILTALCQGINIIDTARGYGDSERKIGNAIEGLEAKPIVASKSSKRDAPGIRQDFFRSLEELRLEKIAIYQLHCVNKNEEFESLKGDDGAYTELLKLKDKGLVDFIGITSHNPDILLRAIESRLFDTIQVIFNLLEPEKSREVIRSALEHDIGVLAMKPLGGGVIENYELAIRYVLADLPVVALVGMATADEVLMDVEVVKQKRALSEEDFRKIAMLRKTIGSLYCRRCEYCQPCHQGIPISFGLQIPSIYKRIGNDHMKTGSYRDLLRRMESCDQCGECEKRCPFDLPIRRLLQESILLLRDVLD